MLLSRLSYVAVCYANRMIWMYAYGMVFELLQYYAKSSRTIKNEVVRRRTFTITYCFYFTAALKKYDKERTGTEPALFLFEKA